MSIWPAVASATIEKSFVACATAAVALHSDTLSVVLVMILAMRIVALPVVFLILYVRFPADRKDLRKLLHELRRR